MRPLVRETVAEAIEGLEALDPVSKPLGRAVDAVVPEGSPLKELLSGTWLGHPVHPPLTDLVIGAWTSAFLLDAAGGEGAEDAADLLVAAGIAAAVPTAAAGLADWSDTRGGVRRVGSVHGMLNGAALILHTLSWRARRRGERGRGRGLSALGLLLGGVSAWLGGHLSFGRGVGVDQTAFERLPASWTAVADEAELVEGRLVGADADGVDVLLVRDGGRVFALSARCSHRGCSLSEGSLDDGVVTCPCHGSRFTLDGSVVRGPATAPQPSLDVRVTGGRIEVRGRERS